MFERISEIGRRLKCGDLVSWTRSLSRFLPGRSIKHVGASDRATASLGVAGEKAAAKFLKRQGYRIIAHGHRQRLGEIDLIAVDGDCVVFVEVKTWRTDRYGDPSEAVDRRKQERITRAALIYLKNKKLLEQPARFDVISIVWPDPESTRPTIRHFKHAFEAVGTGQMYR